MSRNQSRAAESRREPDPTPRGNLRRGQGLLEFGGKGQFAFIKRNGSGECSQVRVEHPIQHLVGERVVTAAQQLYADLGFGHHGRAFGHLVQPLPQGLQLLAAWRTPEVPDLGLGGDDIGRLPPIGDDVVQSVLIHHVFPEIIGPDVHQLHRVKGTTPGLRRGPSGR